jgi:hypothetical protein
MANRDNLLIELSEVLAAIMTKAPRHRSSSACSASSITSSSWDARARVIGNLRWPETPSSDLESCG